LTSITIPNSVTSIGNLAFRYCSGLETVTILAESLESYGTNAFQGTAEGLKIYVPAGSVDTYKAAWADYADQIEAITVATYTVSLKEGTDDAAKWQGKAGTGEYQALPLEGVAAGTAVTVKYDGRKRVRSVKAVKKGNPPDHGGPDERHHRCELNERRRCKTLRLHRRLLRV
jgi:hypothetical protein